MVKKIFIIFYRLTVHKIHVGMLIKILMEENVRSYRYDCVVIGGGASGMMAAVTAAQNGAKTAIIEHTKRLGSKILSTGNGKCNFTNHKMDATCFQNEDKDFVMNVINKFNEKEVIGFFRQLGIYSKEKNGYVYPHSETAASVCDALCMEIKRLGIEIFFECNIESIYKKEDFLINCYDNNENRRVNTKSVILAAGSNALPVSGSDGSGYKIALDMGCSVKRPLPALVQLKSDNKFCRIMAGVRSTGTVKIYIDGEEISRDTGEIQYTDYGISGIPVFQVSRFAVRGVFEKKKVTAAIDMISDIEYDDIASDIEMRIKREPQKTIEQFFAGIVNKKLVSAAAKSINADINMSVGEAGKEMCFLIVKQLKNFIFNITGYKGFENAQVCQGGIELSQINPDTMESLNTKGLYFAGEIVDVDGKCGGYNLQWAFSSGHLAGLMSSRSKNIERR